jgi:hypothetical protein
VAFAGCALVSFRRQAEEEKQAIHNRQHPISSFQFPRRRRLAGPFRTRDASTIIQNSEILFCAPQALSSLETGNWMLPVVYRLFWRAAGERAPSPQKTTSAPPEGNALAS